MKDEKIRKRLRNSIKNVLIWKGSKNDEIVEELMSLIDEISEEKYKAELALSYVRWKRAEEKLREYEE